AALRQPRPLQAATLEEWAVRGWLQGELAGLLPGALSPVDILYEWVWADPQIVRAWRFRERGTAHLPHEALVRDLWANLAAPDRERSAARLREAAAVAGSWWGGAERGWNRRPLVVLASSVGRKERGLPLAPLDDLTAAPLPAPLDAARVAAE